MFIAPFVPPKPKPAPTLRERAQSMIFGLLVGLVAAVVAWFFGGGFQSLWFIALGGLVGFAVASADGYHPTVLW